jgi:hypothetical protein
VRHVVRAELDAQASAMAPDRVDRVAEPDRRLTACQPLGGQGEDLELGRRQVIPARGRSSDGGGSSRCCRRSAARARHRRSGRDAGTPFRSARPYTALEASTSPGRRRAPPRPCGEPDPVGCQNATRTYAPRGGPIKNVPDEKEPRTAPSRTARALASAAARRASMVRPAWSATRANV